MDRAATYGGPVTREARIVLLLLLVGVLSVVPTRATAPSAPVALTDWRPIDRALHPLAYVPAGRTLTSERLLGREPLPMPAPTLAGVASWYAYVPGGAAAGPALRAWLGPDWRGQRVTVTGPVGSLELLLSDWCQCSTNPASVKIIDLAAVDFPRICGPLALGVCAVTITR